MDPALNNALKRIESHMESMALDATRTNLLKEYELLRDFIPPGRQDMMDRLVEIEGYLWPRRIV